MDENLEKLTEELKDLRNQINYHNYRYHVLDDPIISDYEYDQMMVRLRSIENAHPELITPDSPTQRVGSAPAEKFVKVRHPAPILSLANAFNDQEVFSWFERICKIDDRVETTDYVVEPKIDGLTVILHYQNGLFVQGATRGDGEIGEDITLNLRTLRSLPLRIPVGLDTPNAPNELIVRGEAFIPIEDFLALNKRLEEAGEKKYQNPRNTAAGSLRQLDPSLTASRPLKILIYSIIRSSGKIPDTQKGILEYLQLLGLPVPEVYYCPDLPSAIKACNEFSSKRDELPYETDGAVIKINNLTLAQELGFVGKDPRGALAYKFPAREVTTSLIDIRVNVGRTGVLTPYAVLEPVEIGGVIVKQATLHNFDFIAEKDIRVGDRVAVKRAGDVIPYIIGPIQSARTGTELRYVPPETCPVCGQKVENIEGEVAWYCVNLACPAQLVRNLEHFVSRGAMGIVGLGINIVEQLVEAGKVKDVADLYLLTKEDLLSLNGFAEKKAENILTAIMNSRNQPLHRLISALGIRGVGEVMALDLANHFKSLDSLAVASVDDLIKIPGVGPNIAQSIVDWFVRPANRALLDKFKRVGVWPQVTAQAVSLVSGKFSGMNFVVTGTLSGFSRDSAKKFIESHGGKVVDTISKKTDFLVVGENPGSKLIKAQSLNIPIITESQLVSMAE